MCFSYSKVTGKFVNGTKKHGRIVAVYKRVKPEVSGPSKALLKALKKAKAGDRVRVEGSIDENASNGVFTIAKVNIDGGIKIHNHPEYFAGWAYHPRELTAWGMGDKYGRIVAIKKKEKWIE